MASLLGVITSGSRSLNKISKTELVYRIGQREFIEINRTFDRRANQEGTRKFLMHKGVLSSVKGGSDHVEGFGLTKNAKK